MIDWKVDLCGRGLGSSAGLLLNLMMGGPSGEFEDSCPTTGGCDHGKPPQSSRGGGLMPRSLRRGQNSQGLGRQHRTSAGTARGYQGLDSAWPF